MKVVACIFAILSGIFGLFGATAQGLFGSGMSVFTHSNEIMNNGVTLFYLSWIVIILGGLSLKFPNSCGVGLLIISLIAFSLGNIFSAPFAFIAGIFGFFAQSANKNKEFKNPVAKSESGILEPASSVIRENNNPSSADNSALLNQLSQLHTLKEKNVITEQIYEQERLSILSKFQQRPTENNETALSEVGNNDGAIMEKDAIQQDEYDPLYDELFKKNWFQTNKNIVVGSLLIILIAVCFVLYRTVGPRTNFIITSLGTYKIQENNDCGVNKGFLMVKKIYENKLDFGLVVKGEQGEGSVEGSATISDNNFAVFRDENCDSLTFIFKPDKKIEVSESKPEISEGANEIGKGCRYYHGTNICFDGVYLKQ